MKTQNLIRFIQTLNVQNVAAIPVEKIVFDRAFRSLCEANSCGVYGKNWMCPPCVGEIDPLIARAKGYLVAVVYQPECFSNTFFPFQYGCLQGTERLQAEV